MPLRLETTRLPLRSSLRLLGLLFVATGLAALLAEQCFEKLLGKLLGASTPAAAVVLAVYFLGLSLGAASYPRLRARGSHPLRLYAVVEAGVAAWSLVLLGGADASVTLLAPLLRLSAERFWLLELLRFCVACLWIIPPTFLMGLSFPAVVEALERSRVPQPRRAMARFYTLNVLGALAGAAIGPYVLFPEWGLSGVLGFTFGVDATASGMAALLAMGLRLRDLRPDAPRAVPPGRASPIVLVLALVSGFLFFSLEVLWTHLIAATVGSSVYSFAAMLMWVLAGLVVGGALATVLFRERRPVSAAAVGTLLVVSSALLIGQHLQWPGVSQDFIEWGAGLTRFRQAEALRVIRAGLLLLPPATSLGMVYPALFRLKEMGPGERAATVARMGALNSVGCVLGALLTGFALLPALGSEETSRVLGAALAAAGLALALAFLRGGRRLALVAAAAAALVAWARVPGWDLLALTSGGNVYFQPYQVTPQSKLVFFQEDTLGGITTVVSSEDGSHNHTLLTNGKFQANDTGEVSAQESFALVPGLLAPRLDSTLVIGLGSGYSAYVIRELGARQVDIAELAPGIVQAARSVFGELNHHLLEQPNVHLYLEDGRNHLLLTRRQYDLISMEITSVWFAGATSAYCREFYEAARRHLTEVGVLQQWVQLHHLTLKEVGSTLATVREVFPYVQLYIKGGQGVIVASEAPLKMHAAGVAAFYAHPLSNRLRADDALLNLVSSELLSTDDIDRLVASHPFTVNTDWNRYLEYATPRYATVRLDLFQHNYAALRRLSSGAVMELDSSVPAHVRELIAGLTPEERLTRQTGLWKPPAPAPAASAAGEGSAASPAPP